VPNAADANQEIRSTGGAQCGRSVAAGRASSRLGRPEATAGDL